MSKYHELAKYSPHLSLVSSADLGAGDFLIIGNTLYARPVYGENNFFNILDLSDPNKPVPISKITFKHSVGVMAINDDRLYVSESKRALHIYDISRPEQPEYIDCILNFNGEIKKIEFINSKSAILSHDWDGFSVLDLGDLKHCELGERIKPSNYQLNDMLVLNNKIYVAGSFGVIEYEAQISGQVKKIRETKSDAISVERLWFSEGCLLAAGKAEKKGVFRLDKKLNLHSSIEIERPPNLLMPLKDGRHIGFPGNHRLTVFDVVNQQSIPIFEMYVGGKKDTYLEIASDRPEGSEEIDPYEMDLSKLDDITCMEVRDNRLLMGNNSRLYIFEIEEKSIFENLME